ncbi:hypothetical protein F8388_025341 [Cannabis sativa]|uniref:Uncharacterized protein n=1 Tax=Cannabis sativa TaxID=3483 RepID=A0A7J6FSU8_CANSA|nr:hypothetical protein F8388_025341 [Cannabis sativa]
MGFWRRKANGAYNKQDYPTMRSFSKNQPHEIWQPTVPKWEKDFCAKVGLVSWKKILETKKYIHLYDKVMEWNDSACEEAFKQAKKKFWAKINGFESEIVLPGPDIYIDEVDWDAEIDPGLYLDLERQPEQSDDEERDFKDANGNGWKNNVELGLGIDMIVPSGWGDAEEDFKGADGNGWNNNAELGGIDKIISSG